MLPSLYEGLPVVGVEAECCGLPMFFSTEIPKESSPCNDLGYFISLKRSASDWAEKILSVTKKNMDRRMDRRYDVKSAGFDSSSEGKKLTQFYESL